MSSVIEYATLGKVVFTNKAINKMEQYGLYSYHILETIKHGFSVKPLLSGTQQKQFKHKQEKQIGVIFKNEENGVHLGSIIVITCWSTNVK